MGKSLIGLAVVAMLCGWVQSALAMGSVVLVTKENQGKLGLNFALVADRVDSEAVLVRMEIPRDGKLKNVRSVSMRIGPGRPIVAATLQTTAGKSGAWMVMFQVSPELAEKCSVDLVVPSSDPMSYLVYAVELKGYVAARK
jgi:hypothetical protein